MYFYCFLKFWVRSCLFLRCTRLITSLMPALHDATNVGSNVGPNIWDKYVQQLVRQMYRLATWCSECLIQKVWYKRLFSLSRVGDIMEDADFAATTVTANFAFKNYGADKGIQTWNLKKIGPSERFFGRFVAII
jgi:hypothetical protein